SVRYVVAADASPGNQQIADALGYERTIGDVPVPPGGRQDQNAVAVDELRKDADRIVKPRLFTHVVAGQVVQSVDLARVANAERHAEIAQLRVLAARHELTQRLHRVDGLAAATHLTDGQVSRIGTVDFRYVHEVQIRQIPLVGHRAPRTRDRVQRRRNDAGVERLLERLAQERRKQPVFLTRRLVVPLAVARPVRIRLWIGFDGIDETLLVDTGHGEHHGRRHHLLLRRPVYRRPRAGRYVSIARRVDDPLGENRLPAGLALRDHAADGAVLQDRRHAQAM